MSDPVSLLQELVRFRTDLEGGQEPELAEHLGRALAARGADEVWVDTVTRLDGPPAAYVAARFGTPRLLVNAHLDTVPANTGWSGDPWTPRLVDGRLIGLGSCDTKGAIAAILSALDQVRPRDTLVLFSGDEEHGNVVMRTLAARGLGESIQRAVVCEPTGLRLGVRHRGIFSFEATVTSEGGHSSRADRVRSPIGRLSRLAVALDEFARSRRDQGPLGFEGLCLNLARLEGGIAFNVIPARATLGVSLRPPPGADVDRLKAELEGLVRHVTPEAELRFGLENRPFETRSLEAFRPLLGSRVEAPVDLAFWTEAALLSAAGIDAVVFGPGDIAQAHAPDEWVSLDELEATRQAFAQLFSVTVGEHGAG
jgi:acetylornithine deacetylase